MKTETYITEEDYKSRCKAMIETHAFGNKRGEVKLPPVNGQPTLDEVNDRR